MGLKNFIVMSYLCTTLSFWWIFSFILGLSVCCCCWLYVIRNGRDEKEKKKKFRLLYAVINCLSKRCRIMGIYMHENEYMKSIYFFIAMNRAMNLTFWYTSNRDFVVFFFFFCSRYEVWLWTMNIYQRIHRFPLIFMNWNFFLAKKLIIKHFIQFILFFFYSFLFLMHKLIENSSQTLSIIYSILYKIHNIKW